jgi:hypothetical protein
MRLPHRDRAYVPLEKLTGYLLSESHPVGRFKASFWRRHGFRADAPDRLEQTLLQIAYNGGVSDSITSEYGDKYAVDGRVLSPLGEEIELRTVWIIEFGDDRPRFVTAYPA